MSLIARVAIGNEVATRIVRTSQDYRYKYDIVYPGVLKLLQGIDSEKNRKVSVEE